MKMWLRNGTAFAAGILLAALLLELAFRQLPVSMGLYRTENYQRWPLVNHEPHKSYTSSMSWDMQHVRHGHTNNYGHLAPFDYLPRSRPVIVVGDSFVNSAMNHFGDTLQGQLGNLLGQPKGVYGLGANGLSLSDYLMLSSMAAAEFAPRAAVFLIVDGDVGESLMSQIGHYSFAVASGTVKTSYQPLYGETFGKKVRRLIGDSALYRYTQLNLHFDPARLVARAIDALRAPANVVQSRAVEGAPAEIAVVDHFLGNLSDALKLAPPCITLLFHTDTYAIADPAAAAPQKDSAQLTEYFTTEARSMGYQVVELREQFRSDYLSHGKRLDFWPLDRHLNGRGNGIAARAAFEVFSSESFRKSCQPSTGGL